jgi:UDP-GlcNAc:undecaprenyl-phosphate GlcNAc-1-phosphate transferase
MLYFLVLIFSFLITYLTIPKIITFARNRNLCDVPDGDALKVHKKPVPNLGGVGIFFGFIGALLLAAIFLFGQVHRELWGVLAGSLVVLSLGLWDDLRNISPYIRFAGQALGALLLVLLGIKVNIIPLSYIAIPLTFFYVMGAINATNLLDGLDGLASGVASLSCLGFLILSIAQASMFGMLISLALLGAVLGFLPYNFNPASIFMGNGGSSFLGYALAVLTIIFTNRPYDPGSFIAPILIMGLPILDTMTTIIRRFGNGKPLFQGDRSHIYDQLVDKGLSVRQTALVCYGIQAVMVGGGVLLGVLE